MFTFVVLQSEPLFIGISRRVLNVRPTAFYFIKCALSSSQVQAYYLRAADGFESSHLLLVPQVPASVNRICLFVVKGSHVG